MMKGTLWKSTSSYVGSMERRYCVLVGTLILDFETADDFLNGEPPKADAEVIGVSVWKGKGQPRGAHGEGFVYVTRLGHTNYCSVPSRELHEEWMVWMRTALDMALGTEGVGQASAAGGVAISREALHRGVLKAPEPAGSEVCMKSGVAFGLTQSRYHCASCGRVFVQEHCNRRVPLPHHGFEQAVRVCNDCLAAQQLLSHLRFLCCTFDAHLHQQRLTRRGVRAAVVRRLGKDTEEGAGVLCTSLQIGLNLLEKGQLSEEEFSGLVKAEEKFQRDEAYNRVHAGCLSASTRLGDSTLAVVGLLHRGAAAAPADEFRAVVLHLRMLAEQDLDSIDFFWPQVLHAFYLLVPTVTAEGIFKAELLEDFILAMALRSTHLALKLVWWLKGYAEDLAGGSAAAAPGKGAVGKQAHLVRLAVEAEAIVLARADAVCATRNRSYRRRGQTRRNRQPSQEQHRDKQDAPDLESGGNTSGAGNKDPPLERSSTTSSASPEVTPFYSVGSGGMPLASSTEASGGTADSDVGEGTGGVSEVGVDAAKLGRLLSSNERVPLTSVPPRESSMPGEEATIRGDEDGTDPVCVEKRLLKTLVKPTGAQSALVEDELLLLKALRAAAAEQLGLDYEAKTLFTGWAGCGAEIGIEGEAVAQEGDAALEHEEEEEEEREEEEEEAGEREARYFEDQLMFVQALVDIAERLRFVEPITSRGEHLKRELRKLQGERDAKSEEETDRSEAHTETPSNQETSDRGRGEQQLGKQVERDPPNTSTSSPCIVESLDDELKNIHDDRHLSRSGSGQARSKSPPCPPGVAAGEASAPELMVEPVGDMADRAMPGRQTTKQQRCRRPRRRESVGRGGGTRGFLAVCRATDPICPIVGIPPEEGHVFKTKQRAPTLITCEIIVPSQGDQRESTQEEEQQKEEGLIEEADRKGVSGDDSTTAVAGANVGKSGTLSSRATAEKEEVTEGTMDRAEGDGNSADDDDERGEVTRSGPALVARSLSDGSKRRVALEGRFAAAAPPSSLRKHQRQMSYGSDREEVEEIIETQVEGRGSLGQSIRDSEKNRESGGIPRTPPRPWGNINVTPGDASPSYEYPATYRQRVHSDPPNLPMVDSPAAAALRPSSSYSKSRSGVPRPLPGRSVEGGGVSAGGVRGCKDMSSGESQNDDVKEGDSGVSLEVVPALRVDDTGTDISGSDSSLLRSDSGGERGAFYRSGDSSGDSGIDVDSRSPKNGDSRACPASRKEPTRNDPRREPYTSAGAAKGRGQDSADVGRPPVAPERGDTASPTAAGEAEGIDVDRVDGAEQPPSKPLPLPSRLSLNEDLVLPSPVRDEGLTGSERASDVTDVLRRSHRGHQLLRHSPIGRDEPQGSARTKPWDAAGAGGSNADGVSMSRDDGPNGDLAADLSASVPSTSPLEAVEDNGSRGPTISASEVRDEIGGARAAGAPWVRPGVSGGNGAGADQGALEGIADGIVVVESAAVAQARALLSQGLISEEELEAVVSKDQAFTEVVEQHAFLDVQFCVSQAFGESWASKRARIKAASSEGDKPGWDLVSIIVKSNDDLRQEVCALQLIGLCQRIFAEANLDLFLQPYVIVSTGSSSGLVQCLTDAMSIDSLKKNPGFVSLRDHFERTYGKPSSKRFLEAQRNFVNSLAAYSLTSYVLQIKDRHNGNILLDTEGRLIHIDFGFILGMAPGGNFALETCPFKLPTDYLEVMGGLESQAFMDLVVAFTCGFLTLQAHGGRLVKLLSMMTQKSPFPCFQGKDPPESIVRKLNERLMPHLDKSETVAFCLDLIRESYNNYGQRQYDYYQWLTNGIVT